MRTARIPDELRSRPFTVATAQAYGVSQRSLDGSSWRRVFRGVYVHRDVEDSAAMRLAAVGLVVPDGAVVTGQSAAWLLGHDVRRSPDRPLEVSMPRDQLIRPRAPVMRVLQSRFDADDIVEVGGVRVTSPLRTAFDLARRPDLREGVVALDALWRAGLVAPEDLLEYAAPHRGWRGVRQVPRAVRLADPGAESPMESRLRLVIVLDAGLPAPETQLEVRTASGLFVARLDMGYRERRVGIEFDGQVHAEPDVRMRDFRRHNALQGEGWVNLVYGGSDVYRRRAWIAGQVLRELRRTA